MGSYPADFPQRILVRRHEFLEPRDLYSWTTLWWLTFSPSLLWSRLKIIEERAVNAPSTMKAS